VLCERDQIGISDLPAEIRKIEHQPVLAEVRTMVFKSVLSQLKVNREDLTDLLNECDWNKAEFGRRIGKSRTSTWKYMKKRDVPL
jgi:transcriptional regulator of acetoin/glycerol metabolism